MLKHLTDEIKEKVKPVKDYIESNYIERTEKVYKSYCEHLTNSLRISYTFGLGGIKMLIHAFIPDLFEKSTSECLRKVQEDLEKNSSRFSKKQ